MLQKVARMWFGNPDLELLKELNKSEKPILEFKAAYLAATFPPFVKQMTANVVFKVCS